MKTALGPFDFVFLALSFLACADLEVQASVVRVAGGELSSRKIGVP